MGKLINFDEAKKKYLLKNNFEMTFNKELRKTIDSMSIVEAIPIRPKGHWISRWHAGHDLHFHVCSECNEEFSCDMETGISIDNYRYCPNCGSDNREVEK